MVWVTNKEIAGIVIVVILLSSGTTFYLQETGKYKSCSDGWILREDGKYECPTRDIEPQWCHHGSDEGPENIGYRCYLGLVVDLAEQKQELPAYAASSGDYTTSIDGNTCFLQGNLRRGVPCEGLA